MTTCLDRQRSAVSLATQFHRLVDDIPVSADVSKVLSTVGLDETGQTFASDGIGHDGATRGLLQTHGRHHGNECIPVVHPS